MEKEPKITNNQFPFNTNDLIDSHISEAHLKHHKFFELKNEPNKIIRIESFNELSEKHNNKFEITELVQIAKKIYRELGDRYGIIAPADFFVGKDKDGGDVVYSVTDKIVGKNLDEINNSHEAASKFETLYTSIAKYFFDKFNEGGLYLWDLNSSSQYIYGRRLGEQEDKIYLIDTDIWLNNSRASMYIVVYWLTRHMSIAERRFNTKFEEARNYISQFISQPLPENVGNAENKNIEAIKKFLNDEKSDYNPKSAIPTFE